MGFDRFRFDPESGRLWSGGPDGEEIRLTPKASSVLNVLVEHAGVPVPKEQLFAIVWPDTIVSDDALTSCVQELRRALDDDAKQPRFIETRHRRGYRFIAPLEQNRAAGAIAPAPPPPDLSAIAVLPFADMSAGRDQDYLCEGLAEELINALTNVDGLRVASRTASFQFRGAGADVRAVGQQLGVGSLLEGSVRKADDRLRVTVQLIETATGYHRWSQRFDRTFGDVFAIQDEIAAHVVASLRGTDLTGRERVALGRPQTGGDAYEYYLRGRQLLPRMTRPDLTTSAEMFERAIERDASYGPAWAGLATVHATFYEWFGAGDDNRSGAERASQQALELAPDLADSHVARGCALSLLRRYDEAAQAFDAAIRLNPHSFDAYYYYARTAFATGAIERSAELFRTAADARREDFQSPVLLAQSLRMLGRRDEARLANREGVQRAERLIALNPVDPRVLSLGSAALFHDGQHARAFAWSRQSLELYPDDMTVLLNAACLHAKLEEKEIVLDLLERSFAKGWGKRDWVEHDPDYDFIRDDPRFKRLLERLA